MDGRGVRTGCGGGVGSEDRRYSQSKSLDRRERSSESAIPSNLPPKVALTSISRRIHRLHATVARHSWPVPEAQGKASSEGFAGVVRRR